MDANFSVRPLHFPDLYVRADPNLFAFKVPYHRVANLRLFGHGHVRASLKHHDFYTEAREKLGKLEANRPPAYDNQRFGQFFQIERLGAVDISSVF
jgi:hypothetical protein